MLVGDVSYECKQHASNSITPGSTRILFANVLFTGRLDFGLNNPDLN